MYLFGTVNNMAICNFFPPSIENLQKVVLEVSIILMLGINRMGTECCTVESIQGQIIYVKRNLRAVAMLW